MSSNVSPSSTQGSQGNGRWEQVRAEWLARSGIRLPRSTDAEEDSDGDTDTISEPPVGPETPAISDNVRSAAEEPSSEPQTTETQVMRRFEPGKVPVSDVSLDEICKALLATDCREFKQRINLSDMQRSKQVAVSILAKRDWLLTQMEPLRQSAASNVSNSMSASKIPRYAPLSSRRKSMHASTMSSPSVSLAPVGSPGPSSAKPLQKKLSFCENTAPTADLAPPVPSSELSTPVDPLLSPTKSGLTTSLRRSSMKLDNDSRIRVALRCRPLLGHESGEAFAMDLDSKRCAVSFSPATNSSMQERGPSVPSPSRNQHYNTNFQFDSVFGPEDKNDRVYDMTVKSFIPTVLEGYNATVLAYGQTGSGKTHTILGSEGLITRAVDDLFKSMHVEQTRINKEVADEAAAAAREQAAQQHLVSSSADASDSDEVIAESDGLMLVGSSQNSFHVEVSFLQIYNENIFDLLAADSLIVAPSQASRMPMLPLALREHPTEGVFVDGLSAHRCHTASQVHALIARGTQRIVYAETFLNHHSSRAHTVFKISVRNSYVVPSVTGTLSLYDLCGSERLKKSGSGTDSDRLNETKAINSSLATLGMCVAALAEKASFVPFRDSKLTRLLSESLSGNSRTCFVVCVSPAACNVNESLNTCRFASRSMRVAMSPKVNVSVNYEEVASHLQGEIDKMKRAQEELNAGYARMVESIRHSHPHGHPVADTPHVDSQLTLQLQRQVNDLQNKILALERRNNSLQSELESLGSAGLMREVTLSSMLCLESVIGKTQEIRDRVENQARILLRLLAHDVSASESVSLQRQYDILSRQSAASLQQLLDLKSMDKSGSVDVDDVSVDSLLSEDESYCSSSDDESARPSDAAAAVVPSFMAIARSVGITNALYCAAVIAERNALCQVLGICPEEVTVEKIQELQWSAERLKELQDDVVRMEKAATERDVIIGEQEAHIRSLQAAREEDRERRQAVATSEVQTDDVPKKGCCSLM